MAACWVVWGVTMAADEAGAAGDCDGAVCGGYGGHV